MRPSRVQVGGLWTFTNDAILYVKQVDGNINLFDQEVQSKIGTSPSPPSVEYLSLWNAWVKEWKAYVTANTCGNWSVCFIARSADDIISGAKVYEAQLAQWKVKFASLGYRVTSPDIVRPEAVGSSVPWTALLAVAGMATAGYLISQVKR